MQLSRHSDYTLRVLMYLAARPDERATLARVAKFYDISHEHLRKVVYGLAKMGYIHTFQGKGGGFELAHAPAKINIGSLLKALENDRPLIDCVGLSCRLAAACSLNSALSQARDAFFDTLSKFSLADLVSKRAALRELVSDK